MFASLVAPITPPYDADTEALLKKWMPPGAPFEPLSLFRTLAQTPDLMSAMLPLGAYFLGGQSPLTVRLREILILRTCTNSGCGYEWGIHATAFGTAANLSADDIHALHRKGADDDRWTAAEAAAIRLCDALCAGQTADEATKAEARAHFDKECLLAITVLTGWYQTVAKVANTCCDGPEAWAGGFPKAAE
ncbi:MULTISPECIES: carboxymuconolactone decarboxylase family protein [Kordiimonas]|jgi:alkylhydroperoxidase family enzyme|uniref:Alkylhydroperoxidase family enzyme, contains CxxC motif n=1 Tax=Kordiimonas lacus TaxID=637679 RepID=A0A1G7C4Q2_9PROT|nr:MULTISPECIES: carboxymuconolactone decarboxylase family protein [Kordiimonas]SDE34279.1 Alkylhydroperoxidase family enzyme, contains CxxC motif [Kordiimonas lacus]